MRLRIALRITAMLLLILICVPLYYAWRLLPGDNPWPRRFLGGIAWIAGVDVAMQGEPAAGRTLLIANHVSWLDIPALASTAGAAFVAHDGLSAFPVLRWLCLMNKTVFVARHDRGSVAGQVAQVRAAMDGTQRLTIFPEGTTSDGTGLLAFKSSLLSALDPVPADISVQPVLLDYGPQAAATAWVGDEPGIDNFLKILGRRDPPRLTVCFLPPLPGVALANRKTIAAAAHAAMQDALRERASRPVQRVAL